MSTKIYNGYITNKTLPELLPLFIEKSKKIKQIVKEDFLKLIIRDLVFKFDSLSLLNDNPPSFSDVKLELMREIKRQLKDSRLCNSSIFNYSTSCVLLPLINTNKILILFFSNRNDILTKEFESISEIEYYGYWNNADSQEGISDKEWQERELNWNLVLGGDGYGIPIECGFSFEFHLKEIPARFENHNDWKKYIPNDDERKKQFSVKTYQLPELPIDEPFHYF